MRGNYLRKFLISLIIMCLPVCVYGATWASKIRPEQEQTLQADWTWDSTYDIKYDHSAYIWHWSDNAIAGWGNTTTAPDVWIKFDGTDWLFDASTADEGLKFGDTTTGFDLTYYFETAGTIAFDYDGDDMVVSDDMSVRMGSNDDISFVYDETTDDAFEMTAARADLPWTIGGTTAGFDITYYFETAGQFRTDYDADFINLTDDMELRTGTGASADGDFKISSNSSNILQFEQVVSGTGSVTWGANDKGMDQTFYLETAGDYIKIDQANDELEFVGANINLDGDSSLLDAANAGTKMISATPVLIEFRPTAAETLTYTVPTGFDLIVTDAFGYKIAANGSHGDDDINLQHNDGSAADIFTEEELNGVNDGVRFQFDGLIDTENEIEAGETLDCVANEGGSVDCIITVLGYLKVAD